MSYELTASELLKLMREFSSKVGQQYPQMEISEFGEWVDAEYGDAYERANILLESYGEEVDSSKTGLFNEYDLSEEEVRDALEWKVRDKDSAGGRPSKVEKWTERIENNAATLEDARQDMSDPTWYRLKSRVEE